MRFSITELLLIAGIAILLFGGKRLRNLGGDLGGALRDFKKALHEEKPEAKKPELPDADSQQADKQNAAKPPRDE